MEKEVKDFQSIEEIKDYLKNNNKAPSHSTTRIDEKGNSLINHWIDYDMRLFMIPKFLKENKYVFEKYYDNTKYLYLFHQPLTMEAIDNFDIEKVSYIILRGFNIERISEGTIKYLLEEGFLLKLVEKAEELKNKCGGLK